MYESGAWPGEVPPTTSPGPPPGSGRAGGNPRDLPFEHSAHSANSWLEGNGSAREKKLLHSKWPRGELYSIG
jgi:hypothetical protein